MNSPPERVGELRDLALDTLFSDGPDPVFVVAPDGRFLIANPALAARVGVPWDELSIMEFEPLVHPDDRARIRAEFEATLAGETRRFTTRGMGPDGSVIHADIVSAPIVVDGTVVAVVAIARDIDELTDRHKALETRLATAFDGIGDILLFVDRDWRITFLNSRATERLGRAEPDLTGTSLWDLEHADSDDEAMLREAMATHRSLMRRRFDPALGQWLEITGFPAGDLLGVLVRDVTEIEEARQRTLDDARRIHAQTVLLDSSRDATVMRGLDDVIEYANRAARDLLAPGGKELVGRRLRDVLGLDDATADAIEASVGATGRWEGELAIRRGDRERITETRWQAVDGPDGSPEVVFCLLSDVTDRRRSDELLLRTQRMESIGTLAGGIAHDLNNVLTPLMLATQLLAAGEDDPHRARILDGMRETIDRGTAMIRQVLTFARGVEGERTVVDIADLAERFADFCRTTLPKHVEVEVDAGDDLHVLGDPTQLLQVLMNLATNARDAMPGGGRLRLTATGHDGHVAIEVADDGTGMPPDVLDRIFEPFFSTKGVGRGTGLGLPMSQAIARTHGGSLEATSTPGEGTVFRLELPRVEPADGAAGSGTAEPAAGLDGVRVLIVDDEDDIVDVSSLVIAEAGGVALGTTRAAEARERIAADGIDVVLTDLVMPGITGRQLLDALEAEHPGIPVVAMSGVPEQGARAASRANVRATLDKPFTAEQLVAAIRLATELP